MIILKNGSKAFQKPQATTLRSYYFYEVLNSDYLASGESTVPILKERGPYIYEQIIEKRNVHFSSDATNVTYSPVSTLYFRPDLSIGNETDSFMFLNLPLAVCFIK